MAAAIISAHLRLVAQDETVTIRPEQHGSRAQGQAEVRHLDAALTCGRVSENSKEKVTRTTTCHDAANDEYAERADKQQQARDT